MQRFILLMFAAVLAACSTVGPDYHRPEQALAQRDTANAAFVGGKEPVFAAAPVPANWWRLYHDATLDALVREALAANTDLRVAAANIAKSRALAEFADAARQPSTTIGAGANYARRSAEEELVGNKPLANNWVYGVSAGVSYQVDLFGQITRTIEAAHADARSAQAAYDAVRVTVVAETTRAYVEACSAGREIQVAERLVQVQARSRGLTERLQTGGRAIALDVLRSAAQEDQVRSSLPSLQAKKQLALYRLATLTGHPPAEFSIAAQACVHEPQLDAALPIGDGAALLQRRPDVRRAESELQSATARIGVVTGDLYPKITLGASIGSAGLAKDFLDAGTFKFSLGPLISWQFPDRSRTRANIRAAEADASAAFARFDGTVLTALRETESALTVYARDLDTRRLLEQARQKSEKAVSDTDRLFASGRIGSLAVLDATRSLIATEQAVAAADSRLAADQVALFLALGGGWQGEAE